MPQTEEREFTCLRCGTCCQLSGFVRVSAADLKQIARLLNLAIADVRARFTTRMGLDGEDLEVLLDQPSSDRCIFLTDRNECCIHGAKPRQCRTFPTEWRRAGANLYCRALRQSNPREDA